MKAISADGRLYRIGRSPDPWAWPDWADAAADGTLGNRWDDSRSSYRVLYAASERLGAFAGISYLSRLGDELRNWAIFEPATEAEALSLAGDAKVSAIAPDDPDFTRALEIHGLELAGV